jgi:hypothetical protein
MLVLSLGVFGIYMKYFRSPQYYAWKPLLGSGSDVILCLADNLTFTKDGYQYLPREQKIAAVKNIISSLNQPSLQDLPKAPQAIPFGDAQAAHQISVWLGTHGKASVLSPASTLTLQDFHRGPIVLVGAFDNPWTLILLSNLRFSPDYDPVTANSMIRDAQNPKDRKWVKDRTHGVQPQVDYAVISRFFYPETQSWIIAVAGLGAQGTKAASQLLTDPALASTVPSIMQSSKNVQIVIKTEIINGNNTRPQILSVYAW